jgi:hypothetical protein
MLMEDDAWQPAINDLNLNVVPILIQEGKAIGDAARAGNVNATQIIDYYTMLSRSFDPMTFELLKEALKRYHGEA